MTAASSPHGGKDSDAAAANVMKALLFPLKRDTMSGESLRTRQCVIAVSRNDQHFRESELEDETVIRLFEKRYKISTKPT